MPNRPLLSALMILAIALAGSVKLYADQQPDQPSDDKPAVTAAPQAGDKAPLVKLRTLEGDKEVDLASFLGKRPVLLFFGSYT